MHGRVYVNQWERTLTGVRKLLPADVQRQSRIMDACIDALLQAGNAAAGAVVVEGVL